MNHSTDHDLDAIKRYDAAMEQLTEIAFGPTDLTKAADVEAATIVADTLQAVLEHAAATFPGRLRELRELTVEQFHQIVYYLDAGYDAALDELDAHTSGRTAA